ncbi:transporter substrate-binding domain-containing protein [Paucibacter sp. APW11]|uniref:Transporter substrate-binding domain-containing protein n=1 Tax=Roseateles aquae TaxID=3077235 RepID=A0ABU3PG10_9BURK|nr:transporter substrate-binding domain-containing protein [Paucibacter sp. APW11]MDT9000871.1 transporter substrate-binding domain-containing protein [Paucibacter sp. APW11]
MTPQRPAARRALLLAALAQLAGPLRAEDAGLRLVSADFPPLLSASDKQGGPLGELLQKLGEQAGFNLKPEFYPFARALLLARNGPGVLMAPVGRTPDRETQYRWLLPLYTQRYHLLSRHDRWPSPPPLAELRYRKVLVLRGSISTQSLRRQGFQNIREESNYETILRRLDEGSADLAYGSQIVIHGALHSSGRHEGDYQLGQSFDSTEVWLVGSPDVSDVQAQALQAAMERLRADGSLQQFLNKIGLAR